MRSSKNDTLMLFKSIEIDYFKTCHIVIDKKIGGQPLPDKKDTTPIPAAKPKDDKAELQPVQDGSKVKPAETPKDNKPSEKQTNPPPKVRDNKTVDKQDNSTIKVDSTKTKAETVPTRATVESLEKDLKLVNDSIPMTYVNGRFSTYVSPNNDIFY